MPWIALNLKKWAKHAKKRVQEGNRSLAHLDKSKTFSVSESIKNIERWVRLEQCDLFVVYMLKFRHK